MVAKIKSGKSLIGALNYNERKVSRGTAKLIGAVRYSKDMDQLNFHDKLFRLTDLAARNERTKTNTVHISLNFANGENLPDEKLQAITADYMKGIGFESQPYLIYRHDDAGHPHIHIVSTNIRADGNRISLHYLGQNESEKTRKAIEVQYGLVKAEEQQTQKPDLKAMIDAADYGKAETKRSITNILSYVTRSYKYTTIGELNAVLQRYNIQADRGAKSSRMYSRDGLLYWATDKQGNKTGVPLKASTIYGKPTLKNLEAKFKLNEHLRKPYKSDLIEALNAVIATPHTKRSFQEALWEKDIEVVLRQNDNGRIYGVTFIDQKNKAVFNGSDLGKAYSANQLASSFLPEPKISPKVQQNEFEPQQDIHNGNDELLDTLFATEQQDMAALNKFKKKKRKGQKL
ncbi:relaxase/mobilization nuclease domain-containing protein [Mucilaginibacter sp. 21P]|uniref:relaxase/mobilization nuclease domain-containing protein n=1 Tax=Mucilaginibacter sp. 21P TaxID=2778902 RepID=UPI001C56668A|nr:relaxase/mobilization nuclease domain-containing protein [Mucilaginibacter sp. 21P]QXV64029.1 relaxase/mobilization nuclease domain-containing protein [Mucilaginibacter sp. 21P]